MDIYEGYDLGGETDFEGEDVAIMKDDQGRASIVPRSLTKLDPDTRAQMARMMRLAASINEAQADLADLVGEMRDEGVSWGAIGWSVGTSGEAARQRWGRPS